MCVFITAVPITKLGNREDPGTLTQSAPVFPGSSRLGIEPKTPGWLVQDRFTIWLIPDNVGIRKSQRRIQADARRSGRRSSSRFSLLTPTRVSFEPGISATRLNRMTCFFHRNCCRSSQSGFTLLTPTMRAGQGRTRVDEWMILLKTTGGIYMCDVIMVDDLSFSFWLDPGLRFGFGR